MGRSPSVVLSFLILHLAALSQASANALPSLVTNSPFLPPGFQPPGTSGSATEAPPPSASQFEFRGVYQLGGTYYFNIYNLRERQGSWITENAVAEDDLRVVSFDPEENLLVLNVAGEQTRVSLIQTSDRSLPVQTAARTQVTPANNEQASPAQRQPVRRRVIRPSVRTSNNSSAAAAARRRVINRTNSNQ